MAAFKLRTFSPRQAKSTVAESTVEAGDANETPLAPGSRYMLSRFALVRRDGSTLVLESPLAHVAIELLERPAADVLFAFSRGATVDEVEALVTDLQRDDLVELAQALLSAKMLTRVNDDGEPQEDVDPDLTTWQFHDLYFHSRSRVGRHDNPVGQAPFRFEGKLDPAPPLKTRSYSQTVELHKPDLAEIRGRDVGLEAVLDARRSIREYGDVALSNHQLGEFLYRTGRIVDYWDSSGAAQAGGVYLPRPYPAGGALYELEYYVAINRSVDIAPGLYHYDPERHLLGRRDATKSQVADLFDGAARATGTTAASRQALIIIAARFRRVAYKYSSIAYALILKHVGVVQQTMYLVATAMDLAPCAVGTGDSDSFADATGERYYEENAVGEFLLGTLPDSES